VRDRNHIVINENGLDVVFRIRKDQAVELALFAPQGMEQVPEESEHVFPVVELNVTGRSTRDMHGYRHNSGSASVDLKYVSHEITEKNGCKELLLHLKTEYGLCADYHMLFYPEVPVVRTWTVLENRGREAIPVEYVSSFIYQNVCGGGKLPYFEKTDVYTPYNSWCCEAHWKKDDLELLNVSRMPVNGYNTPGFGNNRYAYTGLSSWSGSEYLPMGMAYDREQDITYCFQVESSGQWHIEYDTDYEGRLAVALSGPTEQEHGWWRDLQPGMRFESVPAAFGVVKGGVSEASAALTLCRRALRRSNEDDEKLHLVFNDYMNCLMGDPTEEKEKEIIDIAAELGCEYYCMDAGWYDDGFWWDRVGEWKESPRRFPNGMKSLCDYARSKGLVMGLWVEIESMGTLCTLSQEKPDSWFICRHGKRHIDHGRYLLDFRNPEVYAYCMDVMERLIRDYGVGYFKIDYNNTMGYGSDLDTESCAGAMLGHYRALYRWYEELFTRHPDLVIENCGSGAQRMDYGMLRLLSLQSTSDQTDYLYNSYIAANVASAVTPEQAGMWVYPYEDEEEHVIYNMVNGLLLRPYISGMVWKLSQENLSLLAQGIGLYKQIRQDVRQGLPFFPLGFNTIKDQVLAYGLICRDKAFLAVFAPETDTAEIPLRFPGRCIFDIKVLYPSKGNCEYHLQRTEAREGSPEEDVLMVRFPQKAAARLFEISLT